MLFEYVASGFKFEIVSKHETYKIDTHDNYDCEIEKDVIRF